MMTRAGGMESLATAAFGAPVELPYARRGDLVLAASRRPRWPGAFAIVLDNRGAVAAASVGFVFVPMADWLKAWRVA
jgi:hypothetical protein